jgi:hypothetical protein
MLVKIVFINMIIDTINYYIFLTLLLKVIFFKNLIKIFVSLFSAQFFNKMLILKEAYTQT